MLVLLFFYCTGVVPGDCFLDPHCCIYCAIFASHVYFVGVRTAGMSLISYQCQIGNTCISIFDTPRVDSS